MWSFRSVKRNQGIKYVGKDDFKQTLEKVGRNYQHQHHTRSKEDEEETLIIIITCLQVKTSKC